VLRHLKSLYFRCTRSRVCLRDRSEGQAGLEAGSASVPQEEATFSQTTPHATVVYGSIGRLAAQPSCAHTHNPGAEAGTVLFSTLVREYNSCPWDLKQLPLAER
jgi:hypothetical protein